MNEELNLEEAYMGKSKDNFDHTDVSLSLDDVARIFGHFVQY